MLRQIVDGPKNNHARDIDAHKALYKWNICEALHIISHDPVTSKWIGITYAKKH